MTDASAFDPLDLAMLAHGWGRDRTGWARELSTVQAEYLVMVAQLLHRLWLEVSSEWDSVWAYEVAAPLGVRLGQEQAPHGDTPSLARAEELARELIREAMANA